MSFIIELCHISLYNKDISLYIEGGVLWGIGQNFLPEGVMCLSHGYSHIYSFYLFQWLQAHMLI